MPGIWRLFHNAEGRHTRAFQADGRAINEKVRPYTRLGAALMAACEAKQNAFSHTSGIVSL